MGSSSEAPSSAFTPKSPRPRRPWYLIVVLVLAWFTGATSVLVGCQDISMYRSTSIEISQSIDRQQNKTEAELKEAHERVDEYTAALDHARNRKFPLSVATLLVGAAMVVFAQRAMVGREWARSLLVQLTLAHAAIIGLDYWLTPDVRIALAGLLGLDADTPSMMRALAVATVLSVLTSLLIVLGLTRQRSREFCHTVDRLSQS
jgi:hypothetical protein